MSDYLGFGKANWINTQRPRKAFSKRKRKSSHDIFPTCNSTYKLKLTFKSSHLNIIISLLIIGLLVFGFYTKTNDMMVHSKRIEAQKRESRIRSNNEAYIFLMRSGERRLGLNNVVGAYSEFKLAYNIYPENEHLNQLLIETLSILCESENHYCTELDTILCESL